MKKLIVALILASGLAGCAGTGRMLSYGTELSDAVVRMGPAAFSVYIHPSENTLMLQRRISQTSNSDGPQLIKIAAQTFLDPIGCTAGPASMLSAGTWESSFTCPSDINIRALAQQQRTALQAGAPIHR